jgi:hypothetical protein
VRDGISVAKLGIPAVALVTEAFWPQGDFVAHSLGMPDIPRVKLPHPIAGTGTENLKKIAKQVVPSIVAALE